MAIIGRNPQSTKGDNLMNDAPGPEETKASNEFFAFFAITIIMMVVHPVIGFGILIGYPLLIGPIIWTWQEKRETRQRIAQKIV
jgi:hypothetical protein